MAKAPTSYIQTTGAARTRTVDALYFPFLGRPAALTVYCRFVERGLVLEAAAQFLWNIGGATAPQFNVIRNAGATVYQVRHFNGTGSVTSSLGAAPSVGQIVELCAQLKADGSVQLHQSINGAAVTSSTASAALSFAAAWNAATLTVADDGGGSFVGATAIRDLLAVRGVHSLAVMRQRIGLTP